MTIGVPWGAVAGFFGGRTDLIMMRIVDGLYGLPLILIVVLLVVLFGRNPYLLFTALGAFFWLDIARIVRGKPWPCANRYLSRRHAVWEPIRDKLSGGISCRMSLALF